jgi:glycosyltransferase involved in cell wall biosynthesis
VQAAGEVISEFPQALFVIIGEGSLRSKLEGLIRQLGLESHVLLLGQRNDMPDVYASLDLFVLASIDEGMPMTILEALSVGKAVVATAVGAVKELVIPEQTGLLVQPRDVTALRDAILRCIRNPSFTRALERNGQKHVRDSFSAETMGRRYLGLYKRLLHEQEAGISASMQAV